jgi:hypothetical protein
MTFTNGRRKKSAYSDDALSLMVRGTTDRLNGLSYKTTSTPAKRCACCGQMVTKRKLNDSGRARLAMFRRMRKEKQTA